MKFICNTKELSNACNNVIRAVSTKVTIPTIEGILIECGSDTLSLTGYDFEFGINTILSVDVVEPGAIVINAKVLCDIIRKLNTDDVTIETNGTSVSIIGGAAQYNITGIGSDRETKEALNTSYNYFKANKKSISASIQVDNVDYLLHIEDLQGNGPSKDISLASFVAMCSSALKKPMQGSLVILGSMSIGGTVSKVEELANTLQVCFDSGAKKILLPMSSAGDISSVPSDLFSKFNISFYQDPEDAVYKALGIE